MKKNKAPKQELTPAQKTKKTKKTIIIVFICMVIFMIACLTVPSLIRTLGGGEEVGTSSGSQNTIIFHEKYPEDFDIFEYDEYLGLDRQIYLQDPGTGVTEVIEESKIDNYDKGIKVVYNVINAIINGDCDTYNSYMGDDVTPKGEFTQQQLYNIKIKIIPSSADDTQEGVYNQFDFEVEYMINENNGSFRTDFGSNEIKKQHFIITDVSGEYKVDNILDYTNKY